MIRAFNKTTPLIGEGTLIDETAWVTGDVVLGKDCFILPMTVLRGDVNSIRVGDRTNIQDGSVCHVNNTHSPYITASQLIIGDDVTIGHRVILHGCQLHSRCLIGMGSIIMDNAVVEEEVIVGAGTLVPPNKVLKRGFLWMGSPAREIRPLTADEKNSILYSAKHYVLLKNQYLTY